MTSSPAEELELPGGADPESLARHMIEVHGAEAVTIARNNARMAALATQLPQAKSWLRVVDLIGADKPANRHRRVGRIARSHRCPPRPDEDKFMHISLVNSQENGFKKWSDTQRRPNEDESPDRARPIAVIEPRADAVQAIQERSARE